MELDAPFLVFEPALESGRFDKPSTSLERFAREVLALTDSAVVAVVELVGREGRTAIVGHAPVPSDAEEALLSLWLQMGETEALRRVPPRLERLFPADTALVMPMLTPGGCAGVLAVSPPVKSRRLLSELEARALEYAMAAEERARETPHPPSALALIA